MAIVAKGPRYSAGALGLGVEEIEMAWPPSQPDQHDRSGPGRLGRFQSRMTRRGQRKRGRDASAEKRPPVYAITGLRAEAADVEHGPDCLACGFVTGIARSRSSYPGSETKALEARLLRALANAQKVSKITGALRPDSWFWMNTLAVMIATVRREELRGHEARRHLLDRNRRATRWHSFHATAIYADGHSELPEY